jgi:hypothetical protein
MLKLKKTIVNTIDVLWVVIWLNAMTMFITVFSYYGGSPSPTQGSGINKKGEYVLQSHGRRTVVSKDDYEFCLNYFIISLSLLILGAIGEGLLIPWLIPDHEKYSYLGKIADMKVSLKWLKKRR